MADPVRVEVATAADGRDLVEAIARRGLIGKLVRVGDGWEVEINSPREETQRLLLEVSAALATWLEDHRRPSIVVRVGGRALTVTCPPDEAVDEAGEGEAQDEVAPANLAAVR